MKSFVFVVWCALLVESAWCEGISIIGSKNIRPNRSYTVAFVNPTNKNVKLNLSLQCTHSDGSEHRTTPHTVNLRRTYGEKVLLPVPSIDHNSDCIFSAINDGGDVIVDHEVDLRIPQKTVSIFIQTDKPVYKPGDNLRFRVVVVDIETKPVTNIKTIVVCILNPNEHTVREWPFAKLISGIFESSYQMAATPDLGSWRITAIVKDNFISNEKFHPFEVMEYVLPKFAVKVRPTKILLVKDRKISLNVDAYYFFNQRVEGNVVVRLYFDSSRPSNEINQRINGNTDVVIKLNKELSVDEELGYTLVNMTATVTDSITNATVSIKQQIPIYLNSYEIWLVELSEYFLPGSPYHFKVAIKNHNGLPLEKGKTVTVLFATEKKMAPLDSQGMASFVFTTPDDTRKIFIRAEFESEDYELGAVEGFKSASMKYLQIQARHRIIVGATATFTISSNMYIMQLTYYVVTRGSIVAFGHMKAGNRHVYDLKLKLTEAMAPKAKLLVFSSHNGTSIKNYLDLDFESFANDFEYRMDKELYRPGTEIYVDGKAHSDSIVVFQAIDESALLLGHTGYGLTEQNILEDLDIYNGEPDALDWFDTMGLFCRSDASFVDDVGSSRAKRSPFSHLLAQKKKQKAVLLRLDFPESWLWTKFSMNNTKKFSIANLVPETITSWQVTGFALSPSRGLGIMRDPQKFTVDQTFYMIAHIPYSIKRDEVALIQVTLYNFMDDTVTTDVTLFNKNDEIEFVEKSSNDDTRRTKISLVPSHQVNRISFLIKAKKLGEIAIKIEAVNDLDSDGLEHMLRVTPESLPRIQTHARFIELNGTSNQCIELLCNIPRDADPGSVKIKAAIDPNFIGLPTNHAESLINNIPIESGDLNLLALIPNIVALDYISSVGSDANETIKEKLKASLTNGYANQLKYKNRNGTYRQWISESAEESIFLTSLVANAFVTASKYITVDQALIKDAYSWLADKQNADGCFVETGKVLYAPMQDSSIALTAFVVAAILENPSMSIERKPNVDKAVKCLTKNIDDSSSDYHKALATYALSLYEHPNRLTYLDSLVQYTTNDENGRYWTNDSIGVEISSYALLSYVAQDLPIQALDILQWLSQQRFASGEFAGVQSTFVGLKAMGKIAQTFSPLRVKYRVKIQPLINSSLAKPYIYDIDKLRTLDIIETDLPDSARKFEITFEGTGYGIFQLTCQYHQNIEKDLKQQFAVKLVLMKTSNDHVQDLKVCVNFKQPERYVNSNKTVVEVYLPSGFVVNDNAVQDLSDDRKIMNAVRKFDGSAMFVYYDTIGTDDVCFMVKAHRKFKIAMHRPAYVFVQDTENKNFYGIARYEGHVLQVCDICENEDCSSLKC